MSCPKGAGLHGDSKNAWRLTYLPQTGVLGAAGRPGLLRNRSAAAAGTEPVRFQEAAADLGTSQDRVSGSINQGRGPKSSMYTEFSRSRGAGIFNPGTREDYTCGERCVQRWRRDRIPSLISKVATSGATASAYPRAPSQSGRCVSGARSTKVIQLAIAPAKDYPERRLWSRRDIPM